MQHLINEIHNEDCLYTMAKMPDSFIDLVVTSPPYNCGIKYDIYNDNKNWGDYLSWCEKWLAEIKRVLKPDGRICLNILLEMGSENNKKRVSPYADFYNLFNKVGINIFGSPVWVDSHRVKYTAWGSWLKASSPYIYCPYEIIMIGYKNVWKKQSVGKTNINKDEFMMGCSGIWKLRTQTKELTKANFHPDLPELCIKLLSYENDLVYDPFMGSGTTAVAAIKNQRKWIGSELSAEYCQIAKKRISEIENNFPTLFKK